MGSAPFHLVVACIQIPALGTDSLYVYELRAIVSRHGHTVGGTGEKQGYHRYAPAPAFKQELVQQLGAQAYSCKVDSPIGIEVMLVKHQFGVLRKATGVRVCKFSYIVGRAKAYYSSHGGDPIQLPAQEQDIAQLHGSGYQQQHDGEVHD